MSYFRHFDVRILSIALPKRSRRTFKTLIVEALDERKFGMDLFATSSDDCLFFSILRKLDKFCRPRYENACSRG